MKDPIEAQGRESLTLQKLHEAIAEIKTPKELLVEIGLSDYGNRELRHHTSLYTPVTPNAILAKFCGVKVVVSHILPDNMIVLVYEDRDGNKRWEVKLINWEVGK